MLKSISIKIGGVFILNKASSIFLLLLCVLMMTSTAFAEDTYDKSFTLYAETELIRREVLSEEPTTLKSKNDIILFGYEDYQTFTKHGSDFDRMTLYAVNILGDKIPVGTHDIEIYYTWEETWRVDQFGNKLQLVDETEKLIYDATRDYHCISGWTVWETDWDEGIGTNKARGIGNVSGEYTGTEAWTHTVYTP